ncbi:MAG TPA: hypothetical protein VFS40_00945 [Gemmatimonadales bacterium]|nr:hypothetical protein [Gemmatimonadales bacterium]
MILVRNVFRLQFGRARDATALFREGRELMQKTGFGTGSARLLTDLVAPFYTLVLEMTFESLAEYEQKAREMMGREEWKSWYAKVPPLARDGYREIFTIVE